MGRGEQRGVPGGGLAGVRGLLVSPRPSAVRWRRRCGKCCFRLYSEPFACDGWWGGCWKTPTVRLDRNLSGGVRASSRDPPGRGGWAEAGCFARGPRLGPSRDRWVRSRRTERGGEDGLPPPTGRTCGASTQHRAPAPCSSRACLRPDYLSRNFYCSPRRHCRLAGVRPLLAQGRGPLRRGLLACVLCPGALILPGCSRLDWGLDWGLTVALKPDPQQGLGQQLMMLRCESQESGPWGNYTWAAPAGPRRTLPGMRSAPSTPGSSDHHGSHCTGVHTEAQRALQVAEPGRKPQQSGGRAP